VEPRLSVGARTYGHGQWKDCFARLSRCEPLAQHKARRGRMGDLLEVGRYSSAFRRPARRVGTRIHRTWKAALALRGSSSKSGRCTSRSGPAHHGRPIHVRALAHSVGAAESLGDQTRGRRLDGLRRLMLAVPPPKLRYTRTSQGRCLRCESSSRLQRLLDHEQRRKDSRGTPNRFGKRVLDGDRLACSSTLLSHPSACSHREGWCEYALSDLPGSKSGPFLMRTLDGRGRGGSLPAATHRAAALRFEREWRVARARQLQMPLQARLPPVRSNL